MKTTITLLLSLLLSGCAAVQSVSLTPIPRDRNRPVQALGSKTIVLGLNFDNDFIDQITEDLKKQCEGGTVTGILTKDETINYFLFLVYKRQVTAKGYCVAQAGAQK